MYEGGVSRCLDARTHLQGRRRAPNSTRAKRDYWNYIISRLLLGYIEYVIRAIPTIPNRGRRHGVAILEPHLQVTCAGGHQEFTSHWRIGCPNSVYTASIQANTGCGSGSLAIVQRHPGSDPAGSTSRLIVLTCG